MARSTRLYLAKRLAIDIRRNFSTPSGLPFLDNLKSTGFKQPYVVRVSQPVLEMQPRIEHFPRPVGITEEIVLRYFVVEKRVVIGVVNGHAHDSVSSQNPVTFPQDSADVAWIDVLQRACGGDAVHRVSCQPGRAS